MNLLGLPSQRENGRKRDQPIAGARKRSTPVRESCSIFQDFAELVAQVAYLKATRKRLSGCSTALLDLCPRSQREGRGFESLLVHQIPKDLQHISQEDDPLFFHLNCVPESEVIEAAHFTLRAPR